MTRAKGDRRDFHATAHAWPRLLEPVTRGLLSLLNRRELQGVVAHELSHIGNHDIRVGTTLAGVDIISFHDLKEILGKTVSIVAVSLLIAAIVKIGGKS